MNQFDVHLVTLDPTTGSEMKKTRPCVIISPNEMNSSLKTVIMAPLTSTRKAYPSRVNVVFKQQDGTVALDQMRSVDKSRLIKRLGMLSKAEQNSVKDVLLRIFS